MQGIKTVFIDIDDTLWWFTENSKVALRHSYDLFGLASLCTYEQFRDEYLAKNGELWQHYHHGEIEKDFLLIERFRFPLEKLGYKGDIMAISRKLNTEYLDFLGTLPKIVPGAKELLEYLVAKGYDVNTLSNGFAGTQQRKLRSGGMDGYIHRNILSDDCGITKPMPGIFEYAMKACGAQPETTVMIGDDPDADILGAHAMGWHTIYFNMKHRPATEGTADEEVATLDEIKNIL